MGKQRTGGTVEPVAVELQVTAGMAEISTSSFAYLEVLGSLWGVRGRAWSSPTMLTETLPRMDTRTYPQSKRRSPGGGAYYSSFSKTHVIQVNAGGAYFSLDASNSPQTKFKCPHGTLRLINLHPVTELPS